MLLYQSFLHIDISSLHISKPEEWSSIWAEDQIHESLLRRRKGQHLSRTQKAYLTWMLTDNPSRKAEVMRLYKISDSTFGRIVIDRKRYNFATTLNPGERSDATLLSKDAEAVLKKFVKPPTIPITMKKIQIHILEETKEHYSIHALKSYLKTVLNYWYKKVSSRPLKYRDDRTQLTKSLFWSELSLMALNGKTLINVDESSFDRSIRNNYSWLPKGEDNPIVNDRVSGKATLILATWNTWEWFGVVMIGTVDSEKFCIFMKLLELIVQALHSNDTETPTVLIDNSRTHTSKVIKRIINSLSFKTWYLAPYCPEVAPVEQAFGLIKSKLRAYDPYFSINFDKQSGAETILKLISSISNASWSKAWLDVIRESKKTILGRVMTNFEERRKPKHKHKQ